ncbi:Uncharacterised protein [uncultured archaeon]|nr:Uncharacterised protein [uncultured archaeon]
MESIDTKAEKELFGKNAISLINESLKGKKFRYIGNNEHFPQDHVYTLGIKIQSPFETVLQIKDETDAKELPNFVLFYLSVFSEIN